MRRHVILFTLSAALCASAPPSAVFAAPSGQAMQALLDRAIAAKAKGDFDAAVADFDRAISADPNWAIAYEYRGSTFAAKAEATDEPAAAASLLDKAIADYDAAIRLGETTARAFTLRGIASSDKGDYKRAIADFDRALKLDAEFKLATRMRENATDQLHEQDRQIALDGELLRLQPRNIDLLLSRAALLLQQGRREAARQDVDTALAIDPKNETALAERKALTAPAGGTPQATAK